MDVKFLSHSHQLLSLFTLTFEPWSQPLRSQWHRSLISSKVGPPAESLHSPLTTSAIRSFLTVTDVTDTRFRCPTSLFLTDRILFVNRFLFYEVTARPLLLQIKPAFMAAFTGEWFAITVKPRLMSGVDLNHCFSAGAPWRGTSPSL